MSVSRLLLSFRGLIDGRGKVFFPLGTWESLSPLFSFSLWRRALRNNLKGVEGSEIMRVPVGAPTLRFCEKFDRLAMIVTGVA